MEDLPKDVEDYYYTLVYSRIHSTFRKDHFSECAMALKIAQLAFPPDYRYLAMWALSESIGTGSGIVYDTYFGTHFPYADCDTAVDSEETYQTVDLFVRSRCRDLIVTEQGSETATFGCRHQLDIQHRVIYDFLQSTKMQSEIDAHVPEHFVASQFRVQSALVITKLDFADARLDPYPLWLLANESLE